MLLVLVNLSCVALIYASIVARCKAQFLAEQGRGGLTVRVDPAMQQILVAENAELDAVIACRFFLFI